jgi:ketosteroid isomerase-like protein
VSRENVELFRRALDAFNRHDIEAFLDCGHPDAEWFPTTAPVEGDTGYHGHEGGRRWWANVDATFEQVQVRADEIRDLGDTVLALGRMWGRFRSGLELDSEVAWVMRVRNGRAWSGRAYLSHAEALEALGLPH